MPLISIIVPVYNAEPYLEECIASLLAQDYSHFEIILVEDGSTDSSPAICRRYADANPGCIKVTVTEGKGLSDARNTGVRAARGSLVTFVDADDKLLPGALSHLTETMNDTGCSVAVGRFSRKDDCVADSNGRIKIFDAEDAIIATLYQTDTIHGSACAKLYRRELVTDIFPSGRYYEDLQSFATIYLSAGRIAVSDRFVYYYRPNPTSFISTWHEKRLDALWAVDSIRQQLEQGSADMRKAAMARSFSAYFNIFNLASANRKPEIALKCFNFIKANRRAILADRRVRLKDKTGALLSFFGRRFMSALARRVNI